MIHHLIAPFRTPTAAEIQAKMLAETARELLQAENNVESAVATRDMYLQRLARLQNSVNL